MPVNFTPLKESAPSKVRFTSSGAQNPKSSGLVRFTPARAQRATTDADDDSAFWKVVDFLNRPNYAIMGGAKSLQELKSPVAGFKKGLTGKERITASDVFEGAGWKAKTGPEKFLRGTAGFLTDVLLDPTSYIGLGVLGKLGKGAKPVKAGSKTIKPGAQARKLLTYDIPFTGKTIDLLPEAANIKSGEALGRGIHAIRQSKPVSAVVDPLSKIFGFRPSNITPDQWRVLRNAKKTQLRVMNKASGEARKIARDLDDAMRSLGESSQKVADDVFRKMAGQDVLLSDSGQKIFEKLQKVKNLGTEVRNKAGLTTLQDYDILHLIDPKNTQKLRNSVNSVFDPKSGPHRRWMKEGGELIRVGSKKQFDELEDIAQASIPELRDAGFNIVDNPAALGYVMRKSTGSVEAGSQFQNIIKSIGKKIPKGEKLPEGMKRLKFKSMEDMAFPDSVADEIERLVDFHIKPKLQTEIAETVQKIQNEWKFLVTAANPGFHSRNFISNMVLNWQAGIEPSSSKYLSAAKNILGGQTDELFEEFVDLGLQRTGQIGGDLETQLRDLSKIGSPYRRTKDFFMDIGDKVEDLAKLAHYKYMRDVKKLSKQEAADSVEKYLFNYADITPVERRFLKSWLPFYTWSRKNIPLQLQMLAQRPGKTSTLAKLKENVEKEAPGFDRGVLSDRLKERHQIQLPINPGQDKASFLSAEGFFPYADWTKLKDPLKYLLEMTTPFARTPAELATNYNFYYQSPITKYEGEKVPLFQDVLGEKAPMVSPETRHVLSLIRPLNELERLTGKREKDRGIANKLLAYLLGAKVRTFSESEERVWRSIEDKKELQRAKSDLRRATTESERKQIFKSIDKILGRQQ